MQGIQGGPGTREIHGYGCAGTENEFGLLSLIIAYFTPSVRLGGLHLERLPAEVVMPVAPEVQQEVTRAADLPDPDSRLAQSTYQGTLRQIVPMRIVSGHRLIRTLSRNAAGTSPARSRPRPWRLPGNPARAWR